MNAHEPRIIALIDELRRKLRDLYGSRLRGLYIFGSYARGEADPDSDLDILIVLDAISRYSEEINRTSYINAELSLCFGISVSRVFVTEEQWLTCDWLFYENVRREAIAA